LQDQAETGVVLPLVRGTPGAIHPLQNTILLILGPDRGFATPYRLWAAELGGIGLHIDGEFGLIDWLERNTFVQALVLVDDDRMDAQTAADIAAEIRALRPDVPVILALAPADDGIEPQADWPSFAIEHRPFALSGFVKAVEIARLMAAYDRNSQPRHTPNLAAQVMPNPGRSEEDIDDIGPHSGWWILPMILTGTLLWGFLIVMLFRRLLG
jgi:hypothetical protein